MLAVCLPAPAFSLRWCVTGTAELQYTVPDCSREINLEEIELHMFYNSKKCTLGNFVQLVDLTRSYQAYIYIYISSIETRISGEALEKSYEPGSK